MRTLNEFRQLAGLPVTPATRDALQDRLDALRRTLVGLEADLERAEQLVSKDAFDVSRGVHDALVQAKGRDAGAVAWEQEYLPLEELNRAAADSAESLAHLLGTVRSALQFVDQQRAKRGLKAK